MNHDECRLLIGVLKMIDFYPGAADDYPAYFTSTLLREPSKRHLELLGRNEQPR